VAWEARTNSVQFIHGASIQIIETLQFEACAPKLPPARSTISLYLGGTSIPIGALVVESTPALIVLKFGDNQWLLRARRDTDPPCPIPVPTGKKVTEWVVEGAMP
jgi:hypothetical protein